MWIEEGGWIGTVFFFWVKKANMRASKSIRNNLEIWREERKDVRVCVFRWQFRYFSREIQLFKHARPRLRWPAFSSAKCDFCLHINPNLMMPYFLKHLQEFVCNFFYLFGLGNNFTRKRQILVAWHRFELIYIITPRMVPHTSTLEWSYLDQYCHCLLPWTYQGLGYFFLL